MRYSHVGLIFRRELVDQLRDRRTLLMIFALPIFLYPILGFGMTKMSEAFEQKVRQVVVVGPENLPAEPPLLAASGTAFSDSLFDGKGESDLIRVHETPSAGERELEKPGEALLLMRRKGYDAMLVVPGESVRAIESLERPKLTIYYDRGDEESQTTYLRLKDLLNRWAEEIVERRLAADGKPKEYTEPLEVAGVDLAPKEGVAAAGGSVWARLMPFLLVMMSLTGAFYPAVDLCAGEKERGTMETLLISPASRGEIVLGKFLTVMLASIATAVLNLASMGLTMGLVARNVAGVTPSGRDLAELQPPSIASIGWMLLLLIPLSVFFSALCLALAVMARSMKEGQYYMTPLYMIALPLMFLTLMPGVQLSPFFSLVPITGVALLLKTLMTGQYEVARVYLLPVLITTIAYGALALKWAVSQFQSEGVLFREAERFELKTYVTHLIRHKGALPTTGSAVICYAVMIVLAWYASLLMGTGHIVRSLVLGHLIFILGPPLVMAVVFTSSPRRTLRLYWPGWRYLALGAALALSLHPLVGELRPWVERIFPISKELEALLQGMFSGISPPMALALMALMPALTEELAFRGFILSGLETGHKAGSAVVISAVLFGFLHVLISLNQQFFNATLLGLVLGWLAVKSRSIFPGMVMHFLNNGLAVTIGYLLAEPTWRETLSWLYRDTALGLYSWPVLVVSAVLASVCVAILVRIPPRIGPGAEAVLPGDSATWALEPTWTEGKTPGAAGAGDARA